MFHETGRPCFTEGGRGFEETMDGGTVTRERKGTRGGGEEGR
jgi:hypothetical protein